MLDCRGATFALALCVVAWAGLSSARAATDPVTTAHPVWFVPKGQASVDGVVGDSEWQGAFEVVRTQAWRRGQIRIRMMHSSAGVYLALQADDEYLWADGQGGGAGNRWEVESDDSVTFYFDPNRSRDEYFQDGDRAFGVNLGNGTDPLNSSGVVRRWKYVKGNGAGGAPDVLPGGVPAAGITWASTTSGTVNTNADLDVGWSTEIFLPWATLNMSAPSHGDTIGMNFDVIFDNDGDGRNFADNRSGPNRFTLPAFVDDHVQGVHSSYSASQAGIRGPINYAAVMFVDATAGQRPAAISSLTVQHPSAFGAVLSFPAPAGAAGAKGHAASYDIRVSTAPIVDEASWNAATPIANRYVPAPAGLSERLRITGLQPSTAYYVAVRGRDYLGALGNLSNSPSFSTPAKLSVSDRGRIVPAPNGSGLIFEDGTPFVPVGEHLGMSWGFYRNLFPGDVWDPASRVFRDYNATPSYEGTVGPHLDALKAKGVNTLRAFLEILGLDQTGNPERPRGRYWLEFPKGTFNPDMRQFVLNALEAAGSRGIYLIFSPFDTFAWDDVFTQETPWYTGNGGPLSSIDNFFQSSSTLAQAKARMAQLIAWVNASPYRRYLIGWETMNEWDSTEWTLNAEGNSEPGREAEMRRRAVWVKELNEYIRQQDPDRLVLSSTIARDPRGPVARAVFYDRSFDVLAPHFYTNSSEEPINNPQAHREVMPAEENALLTNYWLTHRVGNRPILNGEWGMTRADWPGGAPAYGSGFLQSEDESIFRTMSWSGAATGQAGQGLRIATDELASNLHRLTPAMRDVQSKLSAVFGASSVKSILEDFAAHTLEGDIQVICRDAQDDLTVVRDVKAFGTHDSRENGLLYVLIDDNVRDTFACPSPATAWVVLRGFPDWRQYSAQTWVTVGATATPVQSQTAFSSGGELAFSLTGLTDGSGTTTDATLVFKRGTASAGGSPVAVAINGTTGDGAATEPGQKTCQSTNPRCDYHYRFTPATGGPVTVTLSNEFGCFRVYDPDGSLVAQSGRAASGNCSSSSAADRATFNAVAGTEYFMLVAVDGAGVGTHSISVDGPAARVATNKRTSTVGGFANAAASDSGVVLATTLNADNDVVVFLDENGHTDWSAVVLTDAVPGPAPTGMPVAFVDPKDGFAYVAYPSATGLMVYRRASGSWTLTNLTTTLGGGATTIAAGLTYFISPRPGGQTVESETDLVTLLGFNQSNQLVKYSQRRTDSGIVWQFVNLTGRDLEPTGQVPPGWVGDLIGYTTPWNGQNVAGLSAFGEIISAWTAPDRNDVWAASNLSEICGTPPLTGGLSAYVNWGINLTGILPDGQLGVTWWSAQYEQEQRAAGSDRIWAFSNLTRDAGGLRPRLQGAAAVGFTTPNWVSNNIYGIAEGSGHLVAYWWSPDMPGWSSADLNERVGATGSDQIPRGKLTALAARDNSISVFGVNEAGEVLRFFWVPDQWRVDNVSSAVAP
jgi:hypothetical protein